MVKKLLLEFIFSEDASITQRSFVNVGAMLTGVVLVAMVIVGLTSQPAWAQVCCGEGCCGSPDCSSWTEDPCNANCTYKERSCRSGCVEYYYDCAGGPQCSAACD